ncbi:hypothetical protein BTR14_01590 [Rhizobium rhizosphaerae]|uniref:Uncharacterized protein n=1 Tax=Xaviernesmea rhizosphaerae TaxID=1672749 RepID=A0ABX3PJ79_9HYPH|nr:hypothetical protein [Xaviernesmea rhizosphaerae]OQP88176.1 hypothetical protein BTR14_01590 [Xaviernesmea rhizosphaerae]
MHSESRHDLPWRGVGNFGDDVCEKSKLLVDLVYAFAEQDALSVCRRPPQDLKFGQPVGLAFFNGSDKRLQITAASENLAEEHASGLNVGVESVRSSNLEDREI